MTTITDLQSATQAVYMEAMEMADEFVAEVLRPLDELAEKRNAQTVLMFWDQLPPEALVAMEKQDPQGYKNAVKTINEMRKKVKYG